LDAGIPAATNSYESIETVLVGSGGQSTISFTVIPATYKHLQIRAIGKTNRASWIDDVTLRFNSDTGSNYAWHSLAGDGSSASAGAASTTNRIIVGSMAGNSVSNTFGAGVIDILDYANTSKNKTVRSLVAVEDNTNGYLPFNSGLWQNTAAITTITLAPNTGTLFNQHTQFALYGIKG
jgi:hypothetical protein